MKSVSIEIFYRHIINNQEPQLITSYKIKKGSKIENVYLLNSFSWFQMLLVINWLSFVAIPDSQEKKWEIHFDY